MTDLETIKKEIDDLGTKIRELKSNNGDKNVIGETVQSLLAAKKKYADNNNGIGVDGKPWMDPKEAKKQQKKKGGGGQQQQQQQQQNTANAQKKAAKKEAKKAAKAAFKAGGAGAGGAAAGGGQQQQQQQHQKQQQKQQQGGNNKPMMYNKSIPSLQIVMNPNNWIDRPIVALTTAIMTNTIIDYKLYADPKARHTALGLPNGGIVVGDYAMARYMVRRAKQSDTMTSDNNGAGSTNTFYNQLLGTTPEEQAMIETWIDYSQSINNQSLSQQQRINAICMTLEHTLHDRTYLVGSTITLADLCLYGTILNIFPTKTQNETTTHETFLANIPSNCIATKRYINMISSCPAIQHAIQLSIGIVTNSECNDPINLGIMDPLVSGMNTLEGAIPGRVVTRFPPEPSGYLHVGHAKAVLLNDYYARRYNGRLIVRFDDTNPTKEKEEYQQSIIEDLGRLGVKPDVITYTSDYFKVIEGYAIWLINNGLAYMDDTPQDIMKEERAERKDSKYRTTQSIDDANKYFKLMCNGSKDGSTWCLRAKIDMKSDNGTMRDPVLYRQNLTSHHRTGTTYKAYPTYDLACPIVDSIEGVTHALRTTEYNDRDEQYKWLINTLKLQHKTRIHAFSRVNFNYTVLSKRKLTWFVDNGHVTGWNDPRFPTVQGVIRRGLSPIALKKFVYSQGASRRVVNMEWNKFWAENKKEIDLNAKRYMAIDKKNHITLSISNGPTYDSNTYLTTTLHPKNSNLGTRIIKIGNTVILESIDVDGIQENEEIVLLRWGVIKITKVNKDDDNKIISLVGEYIPNGDFKKAKRKLSWMVVPESTTTTTTSTLFTVILTELDNLISKEKLEENDKFEDYINPNTIATTEVIGDIGLKTLQEHDVIQLERRGFYRVDKPYISIDKPLQLIMIPDGKMKAMSGLSGKLAHR